MKKALSLDEHELYTDLVNLIFNHFNQHMVTRLFTDTDSIPDKHKETDLSTLTAQEIMDKINSHLAQDCKEINDEIFLRYLAAFPVSMCKREVSPMLRILIGFHYRFSFPENTPMPVKDEDRKILEKVSYDDLAEIFGRSKATISECILKTEPDWYKYLESVKHEETPLPTA